MACRKKGDNSTQFARLLIYINNWRIGRSKRRIKPENLLLLVPRCLQLSDCSQNLTKDITNCKRCGKCKIKGLNELAGELNVKAFVATGGRLALAKVQEPWVQGVVAIACGAELKTGILACQKPVIAVENLRPSGPCTDTDVDLCAVREGMMSLLGDNNSQHG